MSKTKKSARFGRSRTTGQFRKMRIDEFVGPNGDIMRDRQFKALKPGRRVSKSGNVYYEYRKNRADMSRSLRL